MAKIEAALVWTRADPNFTNPSIDPPPPTSPLPGGGKGPGSLFDQTGGDFEHINPVKPPRADIFEKKSWINKLNGQEMSVYVPRQDWPDSIDLTILHPDLMPLNHAESALADNAVCFCHNNDDVMKNACRGHRPSFDAWVAHMVSSGDAEPGEELLLLSAMHEGYTKQCALHATPSDKNRKQRERKKRRASLVKSLWEAKVLLIRNPVSGKTLGQPFHTVPTEFLDHMLANPSEWPTPTCTFTHDEVTGQSAFAFITYDQLTAPQTEGEKRCEAEFTAEHGYAPTSGGSHHERTPSPPPARKRWRWAIRRVILENRESARRTAANKEESERRNRMRAAINEEKARKAKEWEQRSLPGIAPAVGGWAQELPTESDRAAATGKKAVALNERKQNIRKQHAAKVVAEEEQRKIHEKMARNLETAKKLDRAMRMAPTDPRSGE
jgi:hypothetical protein